MVEALMMIKTIPVMRLLAVIIKLIPLLPLLQITTTKSITVIMKLSKHPSTKKFIHSNSLMKKKIQNMKKEYQNMLALASPSLSSSLLQLELSTSGDINNEDEDGNSNNERDDISIGADKINAMNDGSNNSSNKATIQTLMQENNEQLSFI